MAITTPAGSSRRDFIRLTGTLGMAAGLAAVFFEYKKASANRR